jgi:hypothetical protein
MNPMEVTGYMYKETMEGVELMQRVSIPIFQHRASHRHGAGKYLGHYFHHSLRNNLQEHMYNRVQLTKSLPNSGSIKP